MECIDVAIIGAGSAGLSARSEVAKMTDSYRVFDPGPLGTTCARVGCMPSKAFIQSANSFHRRADFDALGIRGGDGLTVDTAAVMEKMRRLRDRFVDHVIDGMDDWREDHLVQAAPRFNGDGDLVTDEGVFRPNRTVIATGTSPIIPKDWRDRFGSRIIDTDGFFDLDTLPDSMAVIGLGPIGLELGQALSRLGVRIIAFDTNRGLGGLTDPDLKDLAVQMMGDEFDIVIGQAELEETNGAKVRCVWDGGTRDVDAVLVAVGRKPNLEGLGLDALGVEMGENGVPSYDLRSLRIDGGDLYIAGDVNGDRPVLHEASDEGRMAGYNAVRDSDIRFYRRAATLITFSDPEIALIGETHAELTARNADFVTGEASFENQGRALVARQCGGGLRIYANRADGCLLGAEMFAPHSEHFAHMLTRTIEAVLPVHDALLMPFYHPVFEEGVRTALRGAAEQCDIAVNGIEAMRCCDALVESE